MVGPRAAGRLTRAMEYEVRLQGFEGPFDLLLHLIAKRELDIYEISLAAITEDYLAHVRSLEKLDLEVATEFLVVAATLIEIKAAGLLPGPPVDEEDAFALSERDLLIARLLEYRAYKEAAGRLRDLLAENAGFIARTAGPGEEFVRLCPDLLARVSAKDLRDLAAAAMAGKQLPVIDIGHITPIRASVTAAIAEVREALRARPQASFRELTSGCRTRIEVIVRFLAVLELVKRGEADVAQSATFGQIIVIRLEKIPADGPVVLERSDFDSEMETASVGAAEAPGAGAPA